MVTTTHGTRLLESCEWLHAYGGISNNITLTFYSSRDLNIDRRCSRIVFIVTTAEVMSLLCALGLIDSPLTGWV